MEPAIGQEFDAVVSGISAAGIFVRLDTLGAEGLIPMRLLPNDRYEIKSSGMILQGRYTTLELCLGEKLKVRLLEASPITGGLIFMYIDKDNSKTFGEENSLRKSCRFMGKKNKKLKK